ncbi:MAG: ABC transporter ATP-binding protein [Actinobacteria bacterium]|nr:ABC transporter ATP-binding protein [Actinomycetota bacterium]
MTEAANAITLTGIWKRFPGVVANSDVNLAIKAGTIHAVVGENGAGKSTLMKILYGMQKPDQGTIKIRGEITQFNSPAEAIATGIGMVHQHFMLAENFTALENIILGDEPRSGLNLDLNSAKLRLTDLANRYGLEVPFDRYVSDLGVGLRQRLEILKVLFRGANILILDEPTAVLVPQEVDELFSALRDLRSEGITTIFISHKLDEVLAIADSITVMRAGTTVTTVNPLQEATTPETLAELMVGSELPSPQTNQDTVTDRVVLYVENLTLSSGTGKNILDGISLGIHAGEILGIAGIEGNGQAELVDALLGINSAVGKIEYLGVDISGWKTRKRREGGIAFIPEDRSRQGLLLEAPLWENRMLGHQTERPNAKKFLLDPVGAKSDTSRIVAEYDVRTPNIEVAASALSGGNQQKLIVGREMSGNPKLLIAAHPTRGVDVGAQAAIWEHIRTARANGLAVLLISADLDELIGLSDKIAVLLRGRIVAQVDPSTITPISLGSAMTGVSS